MKQSVLFFSFFICMYRLSAQMPGNRVTAFNDNWKFYRGGVQRGESPAFDDSKWKIVHLPHDWSIEDLPGTNSPFHPDAATQVSGGFTTGGTGWYRKTFFVDAGKKGKHIQIQFDGVYMNADIWINGEHVGNHPYGYTSFYYDITDKLKFGADNIIAVEVKNEGANSRWYSGSGIYRHVWLKVLEPVHVEQWGTYITTPVVTSASARINVKTKVVNKGLEAASVTVVTTIISRLGKEAARSEVSQNVGLGTSDYNQDIRLSKPELWSLESPVLYTAITEIFLGGKLLDRAETRFGIRTLSFDAVNGFRLNGTPLKLKGGCVHHDNGPLGAMAFDRAEERRVEILKASGYNAIRSAHNPPSPAFLDACDRLGMLVMDEAFDMWREQKNPFDYHLYFNDWWQRDVESMVYRDRNHPSIIMWSIGNEIPNRAKPEVVAVAKTLGNFIRSLDSTRPVTSGVNDLRPDKDPYFATLDVAGYNYAFGGDHNQQSLHEQDHLRVPGRIIVGTESYPLEAFGAWMEVLDHPYVIGDFVWTAWDYIGEASIGWRGYWQEKNFYPWNLAFCGDIDICGWKRPQSYYRDVLWKTNQVSIFVKPPQPSFDENPNRQSWSKWHWYDAVEDWNWKGRENQPFEVNVYSSCEEVELFLNGKSLGRKPTNRSTKFMARWQVPYQQGVLKAVGYRGKDPVNSKELHSAAEPSAIRLVADRREIKTGGQDLSYITVELVDDRGNRNPKAENLVRFQVDGPATIAGVGNANPVSVESYQQPQRKAWQGRCMVIIRSGKETGNITVKASVDGLSATTIVIGAKDAAIEKR